MTAGARSGWSLRARLRRHPIPIEARLQDCLTITYAIPAAVLRRLVPAGLELETVGDSGFIAVALVQARSLRPAGLPESLGQDFFLAGYRVFTKFRCPDGRTIRGLRILRSDTDRHRMVLGGNLLTHYHYRYCRVAMKTTPDGFSVRIRSADALGDLDVDVHLAEPQLPASSPFASIREARRFAGPLPFTFDDEPETHSIIAINARRTNWKPRPVSVDVREIGFFTQPAFSGCTPRLAAAFHVKDVNYRWERGIRYSLTSRHEIVA